MSAQVFRLSKQPFSITNRPTGCLEEFMSNLGKVKKIKLSKTLLLFFPFSFGFIAAPPAA